MNTWNLEKLYKRFKTNYRKIPSQSLRLKGQRCYNQRDYTSLAKTPSDKKQLVRSGHFNRFSGSASNQRKKTKRLNKVPGRATVCHVTKSFIESQEKNANDIQMKSEKQICKLNRTFAKQNPSTVVRREIKTQEDKTNNVLLRTQRPDVERMKSRQRVMSVERDDSYRLVNEIKASIEAVKTQLNSREGHVEKSRDAFDKSSESTNRLPNPRKPKDLMEDLYNQRHFTVKPTIINVYNATDNTEVEHPESVEGIPWNWFREEKFRLRSFVQYPLTAAKSAILLAEDGFVYTGKGGERDDVVTCYFCCVQKLGWQTRDIVSDIHREMSPNCSMVTKINCDNIPIRSSQNDGQNFDTLLNQLNSTCSNESGQHTLKNNADTRGNVSRSSGDIDVDCENDTRQHDSIFNQPTSTRGNPSENSELNSNEMRRRTLIPNTSTFQHTVTTQGSTATTTATTTTATTTEMTTATVTSRQVQKNSPNIAVQTTRSSASVVQNLASVPSSPQITLPHVSTEPRNTGANSSTVTGQPSLTPAGQPNVEIAAPTSASTNSATVSQTAANNGEKKNGKGPTYAELGIITERPKRPEYAVKETRLKTFENWPTSHHLKPEDLADAGFYFAGYGDCARCFYCGGGLRNWEDEDDVWVEHARWFPKCAYIRQQMGQVFVDTVQELNKTLDVISFATVKERCKAPATASSLDAKLEPLKRDPAVLTVVDFGYSLSDVLQVAKIIKGKDVILSSDVLLTKLQELEKPRVAKTPSTPMAGATSSTLTQDQEAIRRIKEKNNQLRQQTVCKICMDKEVAVVFLPCGHLVSCAECASAMKDCPVCRVTVKGIVRAFI